MTWRASHYSRRCLTVTKSGWQKSRHVSASGELFQCIRASAWNWNRRQCQLVLRSESVQNLCTCVTSYCCCICVIDRALVSLQHVMQSVLGFCQTHAHVHTRACTHTNTHPFYGPFSGTTPVSWWQKKSSRTLWCKGRYQRANTLTSRLGATPSALISDPPLSSPHFYAWCPSCHNPPNLSWLGTCTKYAGLRTRCEV